MAGEESAISEESIEDDSNDESTEEVVKEEVVEGEEKIVEDKKDEKPEPDAKRKYSIKVNGKEQDVELTDQEVIRYVQKSQASDAAFREASAIKQQSLQFIEMLKKDPRSVLDHKSFGHDTRKLAETWLSEAIEDELADPRDKEVRQLKKQLVEREEIEKKFKQEQTKVREDGLRQKYQADIQKDIVEAMKDSGLPKTSRTISRIAYYMQQGLRRQVNLAPKDVIDLVKRDYTEDIKELFGSLEGDALLERVGKETTEKIRKHQVNKLKDNPLKEVKAVKEQATATRRKGRTKKSTDPETFFRELNNKK